MWAEKATRPKSLGQKLFGQTDAIMTWPEGNYFSAYKILLYTAIVKDMALMKIESLK